MSGFQVGAADALRQREPMAARLPSTTPVFDAAADVDRPLNRDFIAADSRNLAGSADAAPISARFGGPIIPG
jgi:hypothetical protein